MSFLRTFKSIGSKDQNDVKLKIRFIVMNSNKQHFACTIYAIAIESDKSIKAPSALLTMNCLGCNYFATYWPNLTPQFSYILQIVAVILSTTGIALLAYADGIATTKTLAGVVLAAASAAGSAVYKVFFKRVFGEVSFCQVAIFFSSIGLCSLLTLWTIFLALHLTGQGNFSLTLMYFRLKNFQKLQSKQPETH